ncbi:Fusaric acid resistance protein-like [Friedmanniella luteola]|uniref:Fusaric acid resistance protein-like n=1 Tax=Friedmanniella luteola TaxID=546871 RepID=A0A1H1UMI0_9ACTN|nr:FUSC family protein [Friedmanniella luteola]SDS73029.1 Fusaric acid resistance protein-like [Friedmanniella luteola]
MSGWRAGAEQLVRVAPHAGAHRVALRVGVSVLVPLLVLQLLGRAEWSIYAAFGAFTSLYGRNRLHLGRLRMQATLAGALVAAVTAGVVVGTSGQRAWLSVPCAALLAGVVALASDAQDWHPPGPLFVVFAFTACAALPSSPAQMGTAAAVAAASALLSVVVGSAGWRGRPAPPRSPAARSRVRHLLAERRVRLHLVRYVLAVLLAGSLATGLGIGHPYWAMVSAVVPMAARDLTGQLVRGAHRLLGTGLGLGLAALLLALPLRGLPLVAVVVVLQVGAELLVGRNYGLALVCVTPLALLLGQLAVAHAAGPLIRDRALETLIGVVVGLLLTVLVRERGAHPALPAS